MRHNTPFKIKKSRKTVGIFPYVSAGAASVDQAIAPNMLGRVSFQGTSWFARFVDTSCDVSVLPGQRVHVVDRQGLTLLVKPLDVE